MTRPNIILCFTDQQKATSLDLYNDAFSAVEAKNLKRLLNRGVLFENAYCASPLCVPSRIALMTGRYPLSSGYISNGAMLDREADTLPDRLKAAGYTTYIAGKDHCFERGKASSYDRLPGITRRYDHSFLAIHNDFQPAEITEALPNFMPFIESSKACHTMWGAETAPWGRDQTITKVLTDKSIGFMEEHIQSENGKPFFLHWGPPDPHEYYQVPQEYVDRFPVDEIVLPPNWNAELAGKAPFVHFMRWYFSAGGPPPGEKEIKRLMSVYLGMCALVDDELGRLIDFVEQKGLLDETIFVFSSDHGDMCGEHGLAHKWNGLYEGMTHVPLVISAPNLPESHGRKVSDPVGLVDIAATLCELAGTQAPSQNQGQSLINVMTGRERRKYVYLESGISGKALTLEDADNFPDHKWDNVAYRSCPYDPPHRWTGKCFGVRGERFKLIIREGQCSELYDLWKDPDEVVNVFDDSEMISVKCDLQAALLNHLASASPNLRNCYGHPDLDKLYEPGSDRMFVGNVHPVWPAS